MTQIGGSLTPEEHEFFRRGHHLPKRESRFVGLEDALERFGIDPECGRVVSTNRSREKPPTAVPSRLGARPKTYIPYRTDRHRAEAVRLHSGAIRLTHRRWTHLIPATHSGTLDAAAEYLHGILGDEAHRSGIDLYVGAVAPHLVALFGYENREPDLIDEVLVKGV